MNNLLSFLFRSSSGISNATDDDDMKTDELTSILNHHNRSSDHHAQNDDGDGAGNENNNNNSSSINNNNNSSAVHHPTFANSLPLSIRLLKYIPYCPHCTVQEGGGGGEGEEDRQARRMLSRFQSPSLSAWDQSCHEINPPTANANANTTTKNDPPPPPCLMDYDLPSLRRQNSNASPLVVAPMMIPTFSTSSNSQHQLMVEQIIADYITCCRLYCNSNVNAGVLTSLRFCLPSVRVSGGNFGDADMLALAELLLKYANTYLKYIKRLDFSWSSAKEGGNKKAGGGGFRSHGAFTLSKVLQQTTHIAEVYLPRNRIGPYGASALFIACSGNPTIQKLILRRCRIGERGALAFCDYIVAASSSECGLIEVDLSANYIGFKGILAIENAMKKRSERKDLGQQHNGMAINLDGNLVLQEVMNGVTHGLGVLLAFLGSYLLSKRVHDMPRRHYVSCMVYSTSLIVLYISSTLFHSFFTMLHTRYIFAVIDKCAIYILIAGSYTPILRVVLWHVPLYSTHLLNFLWVCCFLGIYVEAFMPAWKQKGRFSLAMYLGMGWSALVCLPEVTRVIPESAINLMVLGGVAYTAGVPFFVRDNNLDHAMWHLFVLAGSFFHWCAIYFYVARLQ